MGGKEIIPMMLVPKLQGNGHFVVSINGLTGFTNEQRSKIVKACNVLEQVLNSVEFRERFMLLHFKGQLNNTNEMIYEMLMSGESKFGGADGDLDLDLAFYYKRFSRVIGYGLPTSIKTWINGKYLNTMAINEIAGHIAHEYLHKLGFEDVDMVNSVPYKTGDLVEELAKKYL